MALILATAFIWVVILSVSVAILMDRPFLLMTIFLLVGSIGFAYLKRRPAAKTF
ncbi:MAG: hypothetical protein ABEK01_04470 [Candidatus Nanohaloarchaea archaeon]